MFCLFFVLSLFGQAGGFGAQDLKSIEVMLVEPEPGVLEQQGIVPRTDVWFEVHYFVGKGGVLLHEEPGERIWWIGEFPLVVLGGSGLALPDAVLARSSVWVELYDGDQLIWQGERHPRVESLRLTQDRSQVLKQLAKGSGMRFSASYLAEVANFMAGNAATVAIDADQYSFNGETIIDERGLRVEATETGISWPEQVGNFLLWSGRQKAFRAGGVNSASIWWPSNMGEYSVGLGWNATAKGNYSLVAGYNSGTNGTASVSLGYGTSVSSSYSLAAGYQNTVYGNYSGAFGQENDVRGHWSFAVGKECDTTSSGDYGFAGGQFSKTHNTYGFAFGYNAEAVGSHSVAFGNQTVATGNGSFAAGVATHAQGLGSLAMGFNTDAIGQYAFGFGRESNASGDYSVVIGNDLDASFSAIALGRFNVDAGSSTTWVASDPLFTLGNGTNGVNRHNAFEIQKDGYVQMRREVDANGLYPSHYVASILNEEPTQGGDVLALSVLPANPNAACNYVAFFGGGTVVGEIEGNGAGGVSYKSSSADFAEYFELDSHTVVEPGRVVTLRNGKVSGNLENADQLYVVSTAPLLVGNDSAKAESNRALLALMGQVPVTISGTVDAGDYLVATANGQARTMRAGEQNPILGVALESGDGGQVRTLVGTQHQVMPLLMDIFRQNKELAQELKQLRSEVEQHRATSLADLTQVSILEAP